MVARLLSEDADGEGEGMCCGPRRSLVRTRTQDPKTCGISSSDHVSCLDARPPYVLSRWWVTPLPFRLMGTGRVVPA